MFCLITFMNSLFFYFSPLEQFVITSVIPANLFVLGQQLNIMSFPAFDFTISTVTVIFLIAFSTAALLIKLVKSPFNGTFYAAFIFCRHLGSSEWNFCADICAHHSLVLVILLVFHALLFNKEQEDKKKVKLPLSDNDVPVSEKPVVEPSEEASEKEGVASDDTNGDLLIIKPKSAPQAIIEDVKDLLEWLGGKIKDFLGIEPRESLTPLVIIKAVARLILKISAALAAMCAALLFVILLFFFFVLLVHWDLCNPNCDFFVLLSLTFGRWAHPVFYTACVALPSLFGVYIFNYFGEK